MNQPIPEYELNPETSVMYRAMVEKYKMDRERIHNLLQRKRVRQNTEQETRESWNRFTEPEQEERVQKLKEVCNELIKHHPDYKSFKKARVFWPVKEEDRELCIIHWNGNRCYDKTGWGLIDREFPACDIPLVIKRYADRLRLFKTEEV